MRRTAIVAILALGGCSFGMQTVPDNWQVTQEPDCSSSPAAPIVDLIGAVVAAALIHPLAAVPNGIGAIKGLLNASSCSRARSEHEDWLANTKADTTLAGADTGDDDDDDDVVGDDDGDVVSDDAKPISVGLLEDDGAQPTPPTPPAQPTPPAPPAQPVEQPDPEVEAERRRAEAEERARLEAEAALEQRALQRQARLSEERARIAAEAEQALDERRASLPARAWEALSAADRRRWQALPLRARRVVQQRAIDRMRAADEAEVRRLQGDARTRLADLEKREAAARAQDTEVRERLAVERQAAADRVRAADANRARALAVERARRAEAERRAAEERQRQLDEDAAKLAEEQRRDQERRAAEEAVRQARDAEEARRLAAEDKKRAAEEARRAAEEARRLAAEEKKRAEEERRRAEEEKKRVATKPRTGDDGSPPPSDVPPPPIKIIRVNPTQGRAQGRELITIFGSGFDAYRGKSMEVYFGLKSATIIGFNSDTQLVVESPPGLAGSTVTVRLVIENDRQLALVSAFTYK